MDPGITQLLNNINVNTTRGCRRFIGGTSCVEYCRLHLMGGSREDNLSSSSPCKLSPWEPVDVFRGFTGPNLAIIVAGGWGYGVTKCGDGPTGPS